MFVCVNAIAVAIAAVVAQHRRHVCDLRRAPPAGRAAAEALGRGEATVVVLVIAAAAGGRGEAALDAAVHRRGREERQVVHPLPEGGGLRRQTDRSRGRERARGELWVDD